MYKDYGIISLCITRAGNTRNLEFIKNLNNKAVENGFRLFVYQTCSEYFDGDLDNQNEASVFSLINYDITDILVIFDESFADKQYVSKMIKKASENNVACITVGGKQEACPSFFFDYRSGFEKVVKHMIEFHRYTDTVFIAGGKGDSFSEERINIYKKVLTDNGIELDESKLYYGDYWSRPIKDAVKRIIENDKVPEAIICVNDSTAISVCEALKEYGYRVPDDIVVSGFDGTREALCNVPQITTGSCNLEKAVEDILETVKKIITGQKVALFNRIEFDLNIYSSCGCKNNMQINVGALLNHTEEIFNNYQEDELKFYGINECLTNCKNTESLIGLLNKMDFYDICIVVNNEILDDKISPTDVFRNTPFDEEMQVLYKKNTEIERFPEVLDRKKILPDMHYYVSDSLKNPIVFSALNAYNAIIGFMVVCFECTRKNYCKILQYTAILNNLIGNYKTIHYLTYSANYIENMSDIDYMTKMYNRKGFYKHLPELICYAKNTNTKILTTTIDMDGLKNINDKYGHNEGDFAIMSIAEVVKKVLTERVVCGRFGGDEFVICTVCTHESFEEQLIHKINICINELNNSMGKPYQISVSVGVYVSGSTDFDFDYALMQSDKKMYIAKLRHSNRRK